MVTLAPSTPKNVQVAPPWELMVSMARSLSAPHEWDPGQITGGFSQGGRMGGTKVKRQAEVYDSFCNYLLVWKRVASVGTLRV